MLVFLIINWLIKPNNNLINVCHCVLKLIRKVHRNNQVQYQPITEDPAKIRDILSSKEMGDFLSKAKYRQG